MPSKNRFQRGTEIFFSEMKTVNIMLSIEPNIRISIGYKDNFCQVFGINQIFFKTWIKQVLIFFRKKLVFKPEPDPISGWSRASGFFFVSGARCRSLYTIFFYKVINGLNHVIETNRKRPSESQLIFYVLVITITSLTETRTRIRSLI